MTIETQLHLLLFPILAYISSRVTVLLAEWQVHYTLVWLWNSLFLISSVGTVFFPLYLLWMALK